MCLPNTNTKWLPGCQSHGLLSADSSGVNAHGHFICNDCLWFQMLRGWWDLSLGIVFALCLCVRGSFPLNSSDRLSLSHIALDSSGALATDRQPLWHVCVSVSKCIYFSFLFTFCYRCMYGTMILWFDFMWSMFLLDGSTKGSAAPIYRRRATEHLFWEFARQEFYWPL